MLAGVIKVGLCGSLRVAVVPLFSIDNDFSSLIKMTAVVAAAYFA